MFDVVAVLVVELFFSEISILYIMLFFLELTLEFSACYYFISFHIFGFCDFNHIIRKHRHRRLFIPFYGLKIVAHELFIQAVL